MSEFVSPVYIFAVVLLARRFHGTGGGETWIWSSRSFVLVLESYFRGVMQIEVPRIYWNLLDSASSK
jgi:hypothetical protein